MLNKSNQIKQFIQMIILIYIFILFSCGTSSYPSCPLTEQIEESCKVSTYSCAVEDHPQCEKGICMIYKHKNILTGEIISSPNPFCTYLCNNDGECEGDAKCLKYIDKKVCVPVKYTQQ